MKIKIVNKSSNPTPAYQTKGSAGMDLRADDEYGTTTVLLPMERALIPTGIYIEIPKGYEGQIRPRSGLSFKRGLTCVNAVGTIDSDYRGEIKVPIINLSEEMQSIKPGDRIAQLVIAKHETVQWEEVDELTTLTERGTGGFGSTDKP